jgi:hypothetical protein
MHPYVAPTVCTPLYVLRDPRGPSSWEFGDGDTEQQAEDLAATFGTYGLPFMLEHLDPAKAVTALEQGLSHGADYALPVLLALIGERERGQGVLQRLIDGLGARDDLAAQDLRTFAQAFERREDFACATTSPCGKPIRLNPGMGRQRPNERPHSEAAAPSNCAPFSTFGHIVALGAALGASHRGGESGVCASMTRADATRRRRRPSG